MYIINPKDGMIQCITSETPTDDEIVKITEAVGECRRRRGKKMEEMIKEMDETRKLLEKLYNSTLQISKELEKLKKDMYYGF